MPSSFWKGKPVLVSGGAGFIGSYLVEQLVEVGCWVRVVDNLEKGNLANLAQVMQDIEFQQVDLRNPDTCLEVTASIDVVMNLAAKTSGMIYSASHHGEMLTANTMLSLNVLDAAYRNGVPRYLVVSSSCVYPDDAPVPTPELPAFLGEPERPNAGYGWAKRFAELQARYYAEEYGMEIAIARPFNAYGGRYVWQGESSHVIPTLVKKVCDGRSPVVVWGSGNQRRNFLHARDIAQMMMLLTERYACADPVNLAFEETVSIRELISMIIDLSGKEIEVRYDETKPEGRVVKSADSSKLRKIMPDFRPSVSLQDGILEMLKWYEDTFGK